MLAKSNKPYFFADSQVQQLNRTTRRLRKLNRDAQRELQRLNNLGLTNTKYRAAGKSFEILALQMISLLRFRETILNSAREQRVDEFVLRIGFICHECRLNEIQCARPPISPSPDRSLEVLKQDPAHQGEVEMLLLLAQKIGERLSARNMLTTTRRVVMTGLKRLTDALLKQWRHLKETLNTPEARIEVRMEGDACYVCKEPNENRRLDQEPKAAIA